VLCRPRVARIGVRGAGMRCRSVFPIQHNDFLYLVIPFLDKA
jgi:hypothetical protein